MMNHERETPQDHALNRRRLHDQVIGEQISGSKAKGRGMSISIEVRV